MPSNEKDEEGTSPIERLEAWQIENQGKTVEDVKAQVNTISQLNSNL